MLPWDCPCFKQQPKALTALPLIAILLLLAHGLSISIGGSAAAQPHPDTLRLKPIPPSAHAQAGVELVRLGHPDSARSHLQRALATDSALTIQNRGAAAYWLGEIYARNDSLSAARTIWHEGVRALDEAGDFDVRLADAHLRTLTTHRLRSERLEVAEDYVTLLDHVAPTSSAVVDSIFRRRIAQLEPLLPDDVFSKVVDGDREAEPESWRFREGAGDALTTWWRGLDPFPATTENERLEEHVTRLVRVQNSFGCQESTLAMDDRGTVHLRLGAPYKRRPLTYKNDGQFFKEVFRFGVPIPASGFPDGEIWIYPQIDESTYYLFVEDQSSDCFQIARAYELLPTTLRYARGNTERSLNIAYSSLMAMRAIYEELSLFHIDYSGRYSEIANYASYQEMESMAAKVGLTSETARQTEVGAGVGQTRIVTSNPAFGIPQLNQFIRRLVSRADREDRRAAERRKEVTPRHYTALQEDTPQLPVAVRTARFLNDDGSTRTELYWGLPSGQAGLQSDTSMVSSSIRFSALQANKRQEPLRRLTRRYRLDSARAAQETAFVPKPIIFDSTASDPYHFRLQWAQYRLWQDDDDTVAGLGPKRRITLARADSLRPLHSDGRRLEMSDVKVLALPDTSATTLANPIEQGRPYPFRQITADTPLVLAFEVYNLAFGDDDRTRYTLSYEVKGETQRGWTQLFRGQDTQETQTETTVEGTERQTEETILLDLSEFERDEDQTLRVTVRVTDERTGQTRSRTADFVLRPKADG